MKLVGLGGAFRALTQSFVGAETVRAIGRLLRHRVVFSVKGISAEGFLTDPDAQEAEVKRAMISQAATVVLVADASWISPNTRRTAPNVCMLAAPSLQCACKSGPNPRRSAAEVGLCCRAMPVNVNKTFVSNSRPFRWVENLYSSTT